MKISVVMATYNGEKFIIEQLESIINQTVLPDEVIICDDKSEDLTITLIKDFIKKNDLIGWKVYENSFNLGYSANFSRALKLATGDLIFLADQDDIWLKDKIQIMSEVMHKHLEIDLLASNVLPFYMDEKSNKVNYERIGIKSLVRIPFSSRWIKPVRPGCSFCIRKNLLKDYYKIWFNKYPHDCLLWGLANLNNSSYLINRNTIKYRRHGLTASNRGNKQLDYRLDNLKNEIVIAKRMLSYLTSKNNFNDNKKNFIRKQKEVYEKRYNTLISNNLFACIKLLFNIKYYARIRFWFTDLYYILQKN